jgi:predicted Fe-Mo cluster-binding NifX family protein
MRVAIATENGAVAAHFGRCPLYTLVDIEDGREVSRQTLLNPGHEPGRIPAFLHEHRANVIVAGGMGRRAQELFDAMGIEQVIGTQGAVDTVVAGCIDGTLEGGESLCSHGDGDGDGHHGGHHDDMHHHGHH